MTYPAYKPCGVPWLGDVPTRWGIRRLRTVAEMRVSNVDKHTKEDEVPVRLCNYVDVYKNDRITQQLPFMTATASKDEVEKFRLDQNDVIITKDSETWDDIGVPALVTEPAKDLISGYHLAILRPSTDTYGPYLFWALQSKPAAYQFHIEAKGVTRFGLSQNGIQSVTIPVPPPEEQAAIVRYLDDADQRIRAYVSAKERLIALLGEERQVVIDRAVTRGLDLNVGLKPSGVEWMGEIPEHWETKRAKRLFMPRQELARVDDIQLSATQAYGVIPQEEYERKSGQRVVKISFHLEKRRHVEVDDFVISMQSFQGGLERAWSTGCIRSSYVVLRPSDEACVGFFMYLFKSRPYIEALGTTANFIRKGQDLNFSNFCLVDLPLPPTEEQKTIAANVRETTNDIDIAIDGALLQIELMEEYRTRLIADVVTGKLDVQ